MDGVNSGISVKRTAGSGPEVHSLQVIFGNPANTGGQPLMWAPTTRTSTNLCYLSDDGICKKCCHKGKDRRNQGRKGRKKRQHGHFGFLDHRVGEIRMHIQQYLK